MRIKEAGFTFVELLVVITLFAILAVGSVNLFFSSLVGSGKESSVREVKETGEFAIKKIETGLRGGKMILENRNSQICENNMNALSYQNLNDVGYEIYVDGNNRLVEEVSEGGLVSSDYLTSDSVIVDRNNGGLRINCRESAANGVVYVEVIVRVEKGAVGDKAEDRYSEIFKTSVSLRNAGH